ncbi:hypothetical protein ES288_A02G164500v1 [Gossypium darwinii]|uniref:Uncharacterized protein n=1 Tax=Gossypium darwinii TaxID=34276 RepID=A0A5D2HF02_GOSDA|nr:hypothetical protein ES288_A02G164500v1 [Gossypium darwinii]
MVPQRYFETKVAQRRKTPALSGRQSLMKVRSKNRLAVLHISQAVLAEIKYDSNDVLTVESNHDASNLSCWVTKDASGFGIRVPFGEVTKRAGIDENQKKNQRK